jgi:hypothetical protein
LLVPRGPSRPMVDSFQPPVGRASAAAVPAPTARATTAAITVDQLLIGSPGSKRTQKLRPLFLQLAGHVTDSANPYLLTSETVIF